MNTEPEENLDIWDATCWPLRVIVRGDYEYTLVKEPLEIEGPTEEGSMVEAPAPPEKEGWEACHFRIQSPPIGRSRARKIPARRNPMGKHVRRRRQGFYRM